MLEQADATGWMAAYALTMAAIAAILNRTARPATDLVLKFLEHFSLISEAIEEKGLWNDEDGFYYDQLRRPDGSVVPVKVRSMVGILPLIGVRRGRRARCSRRAQTVGKRFARLIEPAPRARSPRGRGDVVGEPGDRRLCSASSSVEHLLRVFERLFDEDAFLSPYGLRARLALAPRAPVPPRASTGTRRTIDYEPAESTTAMFGGNSNWRGPIWFPVNYLVVDALLRYARYFGDDADARVPDRLGASSARSARSARTSAAG